MRTCSMSGVATVILMETSEGRKAEVVVSTPTGNPVEKLVIILSCMQGCPVRCRFCDAGGELDGQIANLSADEMWEQLEMACEYLGLSHRELNQRTAKLKVQVARVGEPALNPAVLDFLSELADRCPGVIPSLSTVAPAGSERFFRKLAEIRNELYVDEFQMQFSIHSTDEALRDWLSPVRKLSLEELAEIGMEFRRGRGKKVTLNFAVFEGAVLDPQVIISTFPRDDFLIKVTPLNPTLRAQLHGLVNDVDLYTGMPRRHARFVHVLREAGYQVVLSVGNPDENLIGSNCGQLIQRVMLEGKPQEGYEAVTEWAQG